MVLGIVDVINGSFCCIINTMALIIGLRIALKYFQLKEDKMRTTYLYFGLAWIGISLYWLPTSVQFIYYIFTFQSLPLVLLYFIGAAPVPIFTLSFIKASTDILGYKKYQKSSLLIFLIGGLLIEIISIIMLFIDTSTVIQLSSDSVDVNWGIIVSLYSMIVLVAILILGLKIVSVFLKTNDPIMNLRGKSLFIAFLSVTIGSILDMLSSISIIILTIARIFMILGAISFYFGFVPPNWLKNLKNK